jgi:hypothetical protein
VLNVQNIIVYADDTTILCDTANQLKEAIKIFSTYCAKYDIQINAKKTYWMRMGDSVRYDKDNRPIVKPASGEEKFIINGNELEKVDRFKFLGFWLLANGSNSEHLKKRAQMAWTAANDIEKLGFSNRLLNIEIKGNLLNVFIRPKLIYGLENACLTQNDIKYLEKIESKIIKKACDLTKSCYIKPVIKAMKIQMLSSVLLKRNISLLKQLMENTLTRKIIFMDIPNNRINDIINKIGIDLNEIGHYNELVKSSMIISKCVSKLKEINDLEKKEIQTQYQSTIEYLFKNLSPSNHRVLVTLLDSWGQAR